MPELREIGLDPAVQGVPVKKKRSVNNKYRASLCLTCAWKIFLGQLGRPYLFGLNFPP